MSLPKLPRFTWLVYLVVGLVLEGWAVANGWHNGDTATEVILHTFPGWMIYAGLGWLLWHFRRAR